MLPLWLRIYQGIVSCGCKFFLICPSRQNPRGNKRRNSETFCSIKVLKCRNTLFTNVFARAASLPTNTSARSRRCFPNPGVSMSLCLPINNMGQCSRFVGKRRTQAKKIRINMFFSDPNPSIFSVINQKKTPHFCGVNGDVAYRMGICSQAGTTKANITSATTAYRMPISPPTGRGRQGKSHWSQTQRLGG